jgi:aspartyl protease family protein
MPLDLSPEWQRLALYAVAGALALMLLQRIPVVGRLIKFALSLALLAFVLFLLIQQAPFEPNLARLAGKLGLDRQEVVGKEVRIRMSGDGHFWAKASLNGVERRMLIDSGATVTALSQATASAASIDSAAGLAPVILRTANGVTQARTGSVDDLRLGNIRASNLKVVISPALGDLDVLGMNFLTKLKSWRVEGRTLILVANNPQAAPEAAPARTK